MLETLETDVVEHDAIETVAVKRDVYIDVASRLLQLALRRNRREWPLPSVCSLQRHALPIHISQLLVWCLRTPILLRLISYLWMYIQVPSQGRTVK